jgi:hypothetical protein
MTEKMGLTEALERLKADIFVEALRIEDALWMLVEAHRMSPDELHETMRRLREDLHKNNSQRAVIQQIEMLTAQIFEADRASLAKELTLLNMKAEGASVPDPPPSYEKG